MRIGPFQLPGIVSMPDWTLNLEDLASEELPKGPFKYYVIMFLTFLDPPTRFFDDLQYCKSSKIAIFQPHPPTSLMM